MTRTEKDINTITIVPNSEAPNSKDSWRVFILYNDRKCVNFWVDVGKDSGRMLSVVINAINLQMANG
jgi:hypothetical protein